MGVPYTPDARHERSQGQANYSLVERCLLFDSLMFRGSAHGVGGLLCAPIKVMLIGPCCMDQAQTRCAL